MNKSSKKYNILTEMPKVGDILTCGYWLRYYPDRNVQFKVESIEHTTIKGSVKDDFGWVDMFVINNIKDAAFGEWCVLIKKPRNLPKDPL